MCISRKPIKDSILKKKMISKSARASWARICSNICSLWETKNYHLFHTFHISPTCDVLKMRASGSDGASCFCIDLQCVCVCVRENVTSDLWLQPCGVGSWLGWSPGELPHVEGAAIRRSHDRSHKPLTGECAHQPWNRWPAAGGKWYLWDNSPETLHTNPNQSKINRICSSCP